MIPAFIAAWFAKAAVKDTLSFVWGAMTNPISAALIAATLSGVFFSLREHRIVKAEWAQADAAATARNERDRLARDALIKATMEKNAAARTAALEERNEVLEGKAKLYDDYVAAHPAGAWTITPADVSGMYIAPVRSAKPVRGRTHGLFKALGQPKAP